MADLRGAAGWKLAVAGCALCWGLSFYLMKFSTDVVSPSWVIVFRFLPAAAGLALLKGGRVLGGRAERTHGVFIGVTSWLGFLALVQGLMTTTAGKGSFLGGVYCVMVPFVSAAVGFSPLRARSLAAAAVCLAGLSLVSRAEGGTLGTGDILCLLSSLIVAVQTVYVSRHCADDDMVAFNFWEFAITGACSAVYALIFDPLPGPAAFTPSNVAAWAFLAVVCSLVCMSAYNTALTHIDPSEGSLIASLEAPFGVAAAVVLGNEALSPRLLAGFALIMCAIVISEYRPWTSAAA